MSYEDDFKAAVDVLNRGPYRRKGMVFNPKPYDEASARLAPYLDKDSPYSQQARALYWALQALAETAACANDCFADPPRLGDMQLKANRARKYWQEAKIGWMDAPQDWCVRCDAGQLFLPSLTAGEPPPAAQQVRVVQKHPDYGHSLLDDSRDRRHTKTIQRIHEFGRNIEAILLKEFCESLYRPDCSDAGDFAMALPFPPIQPVVIDHQTSSAAAVAPRPVLIARTGASALAR